MHAIFYSLKFVINLVELIHEHGCLTLLIFLLSLLCSGTVVEPLLLLLEVFDLDLLLKENNL